MILLSGVGIATLLYNRSSANEQAQQYPAIADSANTTAPAPASASANPVDTVPPPAAEVAPPPAALPAPPPKPIYHRPPPPVAYNGAPGAPAYELPPPPPRGICADCGTVDSIRQVKVNGQGSGVGAVGGGVVGGLLGNQAGGGRGRTALTLLGAVGGAVAGNAIEKNARATTKYEMTVRFEDGTTRTFERATPYQFGAGDRVRVVDGEVVSRN